MREHALADVLGLADVERQVVLAVEQVNAGRFRQLVEDRGVEMRRQAGVGVLCVERGAQRLAATVDLDFLPELVDQLRIGECPVTRRRLQAVALDQRIEIVALVLRIEGARQLDGAQHGSAEIDAEALELGFQETIVEARVVRDEQPPAQALQGFGCDFLKWWCSSHHGIADTGQLLDEGRNGYAGIDQLLPLANATVGIDLDDADFRDAINGSGGAGGFEVDEGEGFAEHGVAGGGTARDDNARTAGRSGVGRHVGFLPRFLCRCGTGTEDAVDAWHRVMIYRI